MEKHDWLAERFEARRSHLRAVAYRMLGQLGLERPLLLRTKGGGTTGMRLGMERALLAPLLDVAFDRGDPDAEAAGQLVFVLVLSTAAVVSDILCKREVAE